MGALMKMKGGKVAGMDGIMVEMMKNDFLLRIFNRCMESGVVPEDCKAACIVPVYRGKGDKKERLC